MLSVYVLNKSPWMNIGASLWLQQQFLGTNLQCLGEIRCQGGAVLCIVTSQQVGSGANWGHPEWSLHVLLVHFMSPWQNYDKKNGFMYSPNVMMRYFTFLLFVELELGLLQVPTLALMNSEQFCQRHLEFNPINPQIHES